jgi:D-glycero-D-manno-heptose 1,7-bisphosphate phosphatase
VNKAIFLDRDGVLNELALNPHNNEYESPHTLTELRMMPGAVGAARRLQDAGFLLFVVSNQPSYAKGKASFENIQLIAEHVAEALFDGGVRLSKTYYCFHHPDGTVPGFSGPCPCRKPEPYNLFLARDEFNLDLSRCWMIGDQDTDIDCGQRAGCRTALLNNPLSAKRRKGVPPPTLCAADLPSATAAVLKFEKTLQHKTAENAKFAGKP